MITLDKNSIGKFQEQWIREVFVHCISKGCEGTKIEVTPEFPSDKTPVTRFETPDFTVVCLTSELEKLSGARLTQVGEKWILASSKVASRCGCGSSFRLEGDAVKVPKEFIDVSLLEAGTSHTLGDGNYFVYGSGVTEITVNGKVQIYSLELSEVSEIILHIWAFDAQASLSSIVVGKAGSEQKYSSSGIISWAHHTYAHEALILASEGAKITAQISATVESGSTEYDVNVHESAILLGITGKVRGIPELKVASDDGKASHSATMERLSGDMLVYLASRGISLSLAKKIYLSARISQTYAGLHETTIKYLERKIFKTLGI